LPASRIVMPAYADVIHWLVRAVLPESLAPFVQRGFFFPSRILDVPESHNQSVDNADQAGQSRRNSAMRACISSPDLRDEGRDRHGH